LSVIKRFHDNISFQGEIICLKKELSIQHYRCRHCVTSRIFSKEIDCVTLNNNIT